MTEMAERGSHKKTPADASEFDREQLRFFLSGDDLAVILSSFNPSFGWLPFLGEMKLIQKEAQLLSWIERNLTSIDAVRDVVANTNFFGLDTANFIQVRLNADAAELSPLLRKCWELIVRQLRSARRGLAHSEWFELLPQLKRGAHENALLERLANVLRPKLTLSKRLGWHEQDDKLPEVPSDLMSIDYEVDDSVSPTDVLDAWPKGATASADASVLLHLTSALEAALADATDVGVESNERYSTSDVDVPSVAEHEQNQYRSGFQAIVRVIVACWTRLATKSPTQALKFVESWGHSPFRLMRRIAIFAAADRIVPPDMAAEILISVPVGELFMAGSSVEVHRLIRARWKDFTQQKQESILHRLYSGPPRTWFREGTDVDRYIDRSRFDILSDMIREGFDIGDPGRGLLTEIRTRFPEWQPKPQEQAGFQIWFEGGPHQITDDPDKLKDVPDNKLIAIAKELAIQADFLAGDAWQGLCANNPDRALRGLDAAATGQNWPTEYWQKLLWSHAAYTESVTEPRIAELLMRYPDEDFEKLSVAASMWLDNHAQSLPDALLWPLWDKIANSSLIQVGEVADA